MALDARSIGVMPSVFRWHFQLLIWKNMDVKHISAKYSEKFFYATIALFVVVVVLVALLLVHPFGKGPAGVPKNGERTMQNGSAQKSTFQKGTTQKTRVSGETSGTASVGSASDDAAPIQ